MRLFAGVMVAAMMLAQSARADLLELTNGDHYRGTVVSMTTSNVEFISEIQGRVILPRSKIAQITFHEVIAKPLAAKPTASTDIPVGSLVIVGAPANPSAASPAPASVPVSSQASAVVEQMRRQGVDPELVDQVKEQIFGKSSPEAAAKFNELMGGFMTGQVSLQDIQKQAQHGIDQIRAAKKELGPEAGDTLDGYLNILEKFVQEAAQESAPPVSQANPAPTK